MSWARCSVRPTSPLARRSALGPSLRSVLDAHPTVVVRPPAARLAIDRFAGLDDLLDEVGGAGVGGDPDVSADLGAARDDRALADDGDPGVEPGRLLAV